MTVEKRKAENTELRRRLEEAEETIRAIRNGAVDAVVVEESAGHRVYTLEDADRPYRLLVEQMQQGAATLQADGTIVYCNRRLADLLGMPHEKLIGAALHDFIASDDRPIYDNLLWQGQSRSGRGEARLRRADGGLVPAYLTCNVLPKDCGAAIGVLVTDLTAQRHHEQLTAANNALRESEDRYRSLAQAITSIVWTTDREGRFVTAQPSWSEYTGQAWEELRDFGWANALHADDRQRVWELWQAARASKTLYKSEGRLWRAASGSYRYFEARGVPILNADGSLREWVGTCVDVDDRRRAEQALRESEERFRNMADNAPVMIWITEPDATCTYLSKSWYDFTGQTPETGLGSGWVDALHPDDRAYAHDTFVAAAAKREAFRLEYRLRRKDGEYRWAIDAAAPRFGPEGRFLGFIGSIIDITERKRAESLVRCQKQALEMVVQGTPLPDVLDYLCRTIENESQEGVIACIHLLDDAATEFQDTAAPSLAESYARAVEGMPVSSATGPCCRAVSTRQTVVVPDVAADPHWAAFCGFALPLGLRACWSTPIFSADQKVLGTFANYYRAPRDPNPRDQQLVEIVTRTVAVAVERKRAEEALRASERRLRFVMDSMPQKIFTAKPNGDVDYFNPIWTEFTGLTFEQIRDWGWTQFIHPDDVEENVRVWQHSIDSGEPFQFEHRFRRADGEYRWHLSRALPMRDAAGRVLMWIGSNTEVHEQKQTANKLRQLAAELSEADRRKNEYLAMLAHELRNPLAPIRNAVQMLRLTGGDRQAVASASEMMERQVGQMVRLVDDLLDVSRISRGKIELRKERIELASAVNHAVEATRPQYKSRDHALTVTLPPQPIYLNADPTRLAQVVGNLLNNSCKFTERGGRIWLTVEREGGQAVLRVQDTGIGIAAAELPRIFEMFTQVDTSLERTQSGLGIGLTLVRELVELHGGTVEAHSAGIGQGSEFVVRLPILVEPPKPPPPEPTVSERASTTARRILVVDDNPDSAESVAMLFKLTGNETHTAYDGLEAVEAAATFRPDVILLDIGLPKLNGYEACHRIREHAWGKNMVLVALTGWGQEEDREKSRDAGFDAHMVKPVDYTALMKLLAELSAG